MCNAVQLQVSFVGRKIVQQENGTTAAGEEMFQCEDLTAVT